MVDRKQLNVKIPTDLYEKIVIIGKEKQQVVADALQLYFSSSSNIDVAKDLEHEKEMISKDLEQEREKNRILQDRIESTEKQLGFLQLEYQKLSNTLTPLLTEPKKKIWWKFW